MIATFSDPSDMVQVQSQTSERQPQILPLINQRGALEKWRRHQQKPLLEKGRAGNNISLYQPSFISKKCQKSSKHNQMERIYLLSSWGKKHNQYLVKKGFRQQGRNRNNPQDRHQDDNLWKRFASRNRVVERIPQHPHRHTSFSGQCVQLYRKEASVFPGHKSLALGSSPHAVQERTREVSVLHMQFHLISCFQP